MAWRDHLIPASFRGVPFEVDSHQLASGRRVAVHEFPGDTAPSIPEDLGRKAGEFTIDAFVLGPDYDSARDSLRAALEQPGSGQYDDPYQGRFLAQVAQFTLRESAAQGGMARFTITFHEASPSLFPAPSALSILEAAPSLIAQAQLAFAKAFRIARLIGGYTDKVEGYITGTVDTIERYAAGTADTAISLMSAPSDLATHLVGASASLRAIAGNARRAYDFYKAGFNAGAGEKNSNEGTPQRKQLGTNRRALERIMRRLSLAGAAQAAAEIDFDSLDEADAARRALLNGADAMRADAEDEVYLALTDLRAAVIADLAARASGLGRLRPYIPPATLPALVIAHRLYGDVSRAAEIVARNKIVHPGFVPGGQPIQVLNG